MCTPLKSYLLTHTVLYCMYRSMSSTLSVTPLQQANNLSSRVSYTPLEICNICCKKNKPLSLSSYPNFALNARNICLLYTEGGVPKNFKTCHVLYSELELYMYICVCTCHNQREEKDSVLGHNSEIYEVAMQCL